MWRYFPLLIITVLLSMCCWSQAIAVEVITGKVVTVDRENRRLVLTLLASGKDQMIIEFEQGRMPPDLKAGEIVRVKGNFSMKSDRVLSSRKIWCSCPVRGGWDRTGVRRRLFEGRGMGFGGHGGRGHGGRGKR